MAANWAQGILAAATGFSKEDKQYIEQTIKAAGGRRVICCFFTAQRNGATASHEL